MRRTVASALVAGAFLLGMAPTAHAAPAAPTRESYGTPGYSIDIIGRPKSLAPGVSEVGVRYSCLPATDVQIGVKLDAEGAPPRVTQTNRGARFGYPFVPATCDGKTHVTSVRVTAIPDALLFGGINVAPKDHVRVGVDLVDYEAVPGVGELPLAALAGARVTGVRLVGGGAGARV